MRVGSDGGKLGLRRVVMALTTLALLVLPVMPPAAQAMPAAAATAADCAGHHAMPAAQQDHEAPQPPELPHGTCCLAGQCPMLAALPPPAPLALAGPGLGLREGAGTRAEPPGILRGPPRPPPRAQG